MRALGLVPRPLALALAGRVGFDHDRAAGIGRLDLGELDPRRLGDAGRVEEAVAVAGFEQDRGAVVGKLEDRRASWPTASLSAAG